MRVTIAYISVILLWATTPLAIKWSAEGPGFIFAITARMLLGTFCMLLFLTLRKQKLPEHSKAKKTYFAIAVQLYGTMTLVYWGAQFIPSGWVSLVFGLSPFLTAIFAALWIQEKSLTLGKIISYLFGVLGLGVMFSSAIQLSQNAVLGIISVLLAVSIQTASSVWVKRIDAQLPANIQVAGGLLFALPAFLATWILQGDGLFPEQLSIINSITILYLGLVATTIGFILYYYVLINLPATSVGMIPMISPVIAITLGTLINHEPFTLKVAIGSALILSALLIHQFFDFFVNKFRPQS